MAKRRKNPYIFAPELNEKKGRRFLRGFFFILLALGLAIFLANYIVDHQVTYDKQKVTIIELPDDLEQWSILHISDLHGRELGDKQGILRNTFGANLRVSCVVFTGDMLGPNGELQPFLDLVALLPAETPKLYVPGDEDLDYLDPAPHGSLSPLADWAIELENAGVTILDEPVLFTRGKKNDARIWFVPEYLYELDVDHLEGAYQTQRDSLTGNLTPEQAAQRRVADYQISRAQRIREAIGSMLPGDIQIAVTHTPLTGGYVAEMSQRSSTKHVFSLPNVSLVLAGHYCAGQVRIPFKGALYMPEYGWFPDDALITGLHEVGGIQQYISPGLSGSSTYPYIPFRLFNSPGVTYIELTSKLY